MEEENYTNRNGQNLLENVKIIREKSKQDVNVSHKSGLKSAIENKYSERYNKIYCFYMNDKFLYFYMYK